MRFKAMKLKIQTEPFAAALRAVGRRTQERVLRELQHARSIQEETGPAVRGRVRETEEDDRR
jgi:hypothetical protein